MAIVERRTKGGIVYWIATSFRGRVYWERAGRNRRDAERLDAQRKREARAGSFAPGSQSGAVTLAAYAETWLAARANRTAQDDAIRMNRHVLTRPWAASKRLRDWTLADSMRLVRELQAEMPHERQRTVRNIWGVVRTLLRDATIAKLVQEDAIHLPRGVLRSLPRAKRDVYELAEIERLVCSDALELRWRTAWAILFCSGVRKGELAGLRWRDWDPGATPLGSLRVARQYDGATLKGAEYSGGHERLVPVHPALATLLERWRADWGLVGLREPTGLDPIIPQHYRGARGAPHTESSIYKAWLASCRSVAVPNRSVHATRNTMISWARRAGANVDALEAITHNSAGAIIDRYTRWSWEPLCAVVERLPYEFLTRRLTHSAIQHDSRGAMVEASGIEQPGNVAVFPSFTASRGSR